MSAKHSRAAQPIARGYRPRPITERNADEAHRKASRPSAYAATARCNKRCSIANIAAPARVRRSILS